MSVYILHVVPYYLILRFDLFPETVWCTGLFTVLMSLIITLALAAKPVYDSIEYIGNLSLKCLCKKENAKI